MSTRDMGVAGYGILETHPEWTGSRILLGRGNTPFATARDAFAWGRFVLETSYGTRTSYRLSVVEITEIEKL